MTDDLKYVAATLAAARLAKVAEPSAEAAARYFLDAFAELEAMDFEFPGHTSDPDEMIEDDVDPTWLGAR